MLKNGDRFWIRSCPHFVVILACCVLLRHDFVGSQLPNSPQLRTPAPPALDLITSYVTVTANKGVAPRLFAKDFHLMEDGVEQKIEYFAVQDQPASIGLLWGAGTGFDSEAPDPTVRDCPRDFMKNMPVGSEYFVLSGDKVTTSYTTNLSLIPNNYAWSNASSDTVFIGLDVLKEAASSRKILFVVSKPDGGSGGHLQNEYLERVAINQGYQIHVVVFISDGREANLPGQIFLSEMSDLTGGSFTLSNVSNVLCANLAKELRVQYMLGYRPTNRAKDGKWRRLSVKVDSTDAATKLKARIRRGYYAAKDRR